MTSHVDTHIPGPTREERGQATVEFALVLPILLLVLFAAIEFGTAFWKYQQVSHSASQGARIAAVSRTASDRQSRIVTAVQNGSPGLNPAISSSNVTITSSWDPGDPVTVRVSYPLQLSFLGKTYYNSNITSSRTARVEH